MTYKQIDPADLDQYIGRYITAVFDYGWDMNDWPESGYLRGVEDGYVYIQREDDGEHYEDFRELSGSAISCCASVSVWY